MEDQDNPHRQKEIIIAYFEKERDVWLGARALARDEPCGETFEIKQMSMDRIDALLDGYLDLELVSTYE